MTSGQRQCDIAIIIVRKRGRDVMTLRERCDDTNKEVIVVKEGWRESGRDEGMRAGQR